MKYCSICKKIQKPGHGSFFRVPNDDRRLKWNKICGKDLSRHSIVCMDHFAKSSIIKSGRSALLLPNAVPVNDINVAVPKDPENVLFENPTEDVAPYLSNLNNNILPPYLQDEHIMQMPHMKTFSCTGSTQTNTRLCGLVQASSYSDEFRFNCFYCSEVFALEKWKNFVKHLKDKHFEIEIAFKTTKYLSEDHDYTPISLPPSSPAESAIENIVIKSEPEDPLEPVNKPFESVVFSPALCYEPDDDKSFLNNIEILKKSDQTDNSEISMELGNDKKGADKCTLNRKKTKSNAKKTPKITTLSRCLKRTNTIEEMDPEEKVCYTSVSIEIIEQKSTEIAFEYTPRDIVYSLLDSMKNYDVLWQFDGEPFNEDFYDAVENIRKIINERWSLNIDNLKMRRSINRILRFYCYLYPNANVENIDQFTNYYDKCATFLPSSVNEIAYARCSHCYICYRHDFDLKRHLLEEQKHLQWPYKCVQCKECFRESDDYEFHNLLPHYDEIFRCEPCNKAFIHRNIYNRHILVYHPVEKPEYKCDVCNKAFQTTSGLRYHKMTHGERKFKCHLCPKSFFATARLSIHLKIHRKQYDYVCEVCGKGFLAHSALSRHMKKHTGAKVSCNICNLKLRKSSLRRHLRVVHEGFKENSKKTRRKGGDYKRLIKSRTLRPYKRKCEERKYHCKICQIYFDSYKLIVEHNKELHADIPKWPCKMCTTEFSHSINLKRHYRKKHNLHVIQVFKLVHENEDLNVVLNMKAEVLDELTQNLIASRNGPDDLAETNITSPSKSDLLPDEIFFEVEKNHNSIIHDELSENANDIITHEIEIDYMNDLFTDILKEQQKDA